MILAPKLAKNFILLFGGSVFGQAFYFLGLLHLAHVTSPAEFGVWNFSQAWLLYLLRAGELGLEVLAIREISRLPNETPQWINRVVTIRCFLALTLLALSIIMTLSGAFPEGTENLLLIFSLAVLPMAFTLEWVFEAKQDLRVVGAARIFKGLFFALIVYFTIHKPSDIAIAAGAYLVSLTMPTGIVAFLALKRYGWGKLSLTIKEITTVIKGALPIGIATILSQYSLFIGTTIVGYLLSKEELGFYSAAQRLIVFIWAYVIVSANRVVLPTLSSMYVTDKEMFTAFIQRFFRLSVLLAFPLGIIVTLSSSFILPALFTSRYSPSIPIIEILVWALVIGIIRSIFEISLIASNRQRQYLNGMILLALTHTIITPLLTLNYGIIGAAYAALLSESIYFLYLLVKFVQWQMKTIWESLLKPMLATAVAITLIVTVNFHLTAVNVISALGVYFFLLFISGTISLQDLKMVVKLFSSFERKAKA